MKNFKTFEEFCLEKQNDYIERDIQIKNSLKMLINRFNISDPIEFEKEAKKYLEESKFSKDAFINYLNNIKEDILTDSSNVIYGDLVIDYVKTIDKILNSIKLFENKNISEFYYSDTTNMTKELAKEMLEFLDKNGEHALVKEYKHKVSDNIISSIIGIWATSNKPLENILDDYWKRHLKIYDKDKNLVENLSENQTLKNKILKFFDHKIGVIQAKYELSEIDEAIIDVLSDMKHDIETDNF